MRGTSRRRRRRAVAEDRGTGGSGERGVCCRNHYLEYLSRLVRARGVDPLPLLAVDDLETLVRRAALRLPPRPYGSLEGVYRRALGQVCDGACCCRPHYTEYLAGLARALDPIPIMDVPELVAELRRRALPLPERGPWDTDPIYAGMCAEVPPRLAGVSRPLSPLASFYTYWTDFKEFVIYFFMNKQSDHAVET